MIYKFKSSQKHLLCRTVSKGLLPYQSDLGKYYFQSQTNPIHMSQTNPLHMLETNPPSAGSVWALERWTVVSLSGQFYLPASTTCYQPPTCPPRPTQRSSIASQISTQNRHKYHCIWHYKYERKGRRNSYFLRLIICVGVNKIYEWLRSL